ncbi:MAG: hypothetical protein AAF236_11430 [Verrucomicrobiota bacterium]
MKKFVMILGALATLAAIVVGILNKRDFDGVLTALDDMRGQVKEVSAKLNTAEAERDQAVEEETQAKDQRNQASADVAGVQQELKVLERSIEDVTAELKKVEIQQKEIDLAIRREFPDGNIESIEQLQAQLTMLQDGLTEVQARKTELEASLAAASQAKQQQVARVRKEEEFQVERAKALALNGLVATVIAVNRDWGFVMVNAGRIHGVKGDSSLLVKRGNIHVARLRIVNLEDDLTVTDVVEGSTNQGVDIQPGDKVIFEN